MLNEYGISNILVDVDLLETEFKQMGKPHLISAFQELRLVSHPIISYPHSIPYYHVLVRQPLLF